MKDIEHDIKLMKVLNHATTHDNYFDKYLPVRMQGIIRETLLACLSGKERRRFQLYDHEKSSILYQALLMDNGTGDIVELMRNLHAKASIEIIEEDLRRKKQDAIEEAN